VRLRLIAVLAVAVAGIAALAGGFFLLTEPGLRILVVQASSLAPGTLTVDQARGRVAGPMHLTGVRYVDGDLVVEAADLRADLVLSSFLAGRVDLAEVAVSGLAVRLPPPSEDQAPAREGPPEIRAPLTLRLHGGVVEDVTIIPHQGDPVVIERIAASGAIGRKGLSVDSLVVTRETLVLDVSGRIRNDSPQPVDIRYAWSLETEDRASFQGDGEITGSWTALTVRHRLASPFTSHLLLDVRDLLQNPSARLELTFAGLSPADLVTGLPEGDLSGEAAGAGGPDSFSLDASLDGEVAGTMDLAGVLNLTREGPVLKLESGKLQSVKAGMDLSVTGQLDTADLAAPLTLAAGWRNLAWPPGAAEPLVKSREGELEAKGRREAFTARLAAHLEGKGIGPGTGTMSGAGDEKGFALESFRLPILGGEVLGTGSVQWAEGLAWRLTARGSDLDPGLVREDWPGRVTLALEGSGRHREGDRNLLLKVSAIGGTLRGNELGGSAELAAEGPILRIRELNLSMGSSRLTAEGLADDEWDISASFKSGDIGVLAPEAGGSAAGSLALTGPRASPRVQARLEGDRLAVGGFRAGHLSAKADAAMDPDAPFRADIEMIGAAVGEGAAGTLALTGSGSWKKHRVVIEAASGEKKAAAVIEGGADSGMWSGDMNASLLGGSVTGRWSVGLGEPSRWDAALTVAGIDPGELRPGLAGEISLEAAGKGEGGPGARLVGARFRIGGTYKGPSGAGSSVPRSRGKQRRAYLHECAAGAIQPGGFRRHPSRSQPQRQALRPFLRRTHEPDGWPGRAHGFHHGPGLCARAPAFRFGFGPFAPCRRFRGRDPGGRLRNGAG
jgi:translocation and assembly module TamB